MLGAMGLMGVRGGRVNDRKSVPTPGIRCYLKRLRSSVDRLEAKCEIVRLDSTGENCRQHRGTKIEDSSIRVFGVGDCIHKNVPQESMTD